MMEAVTFTQSRQTVQEEATRHISEQLPEYEVETKGVHIQDVILPEQLVEVLTRREIANQEIETFRWAKQYRRLPSASLPRTPLLYSSTFSTRFCHGLRASR